MRLILIYHPSEGGKLSRPSTVVSVQPVPKAVHRSYFHFKNTETFCLQLGFDPGTS